MTLPTASHRLVGLEPDNLLAFLALLGTLRALEHRRPGWRARASWDLGCQPLRPVLQLAESVPAQVLCEAVAEGVAGLLASLEFGAAIDLKMDVEMARVLLGSAMKTAAPDERFGADLMAALICDGAIDEAGEKVEPTPLAYPSVATSNFLKSFRILSGSSKPERRARDPAYPMTDAAVIAQALFEVWARADRPAGLRWDPDEAKRHAYQWRAPTKDPPTTQHGANRLAIVGLSAMTAAPRQLGKRTRLRPLGGVGEGDNFALAWPIWSDPASLAAIRAMLSHPKLRVVGGLDNLSVDHVRESRRISLERLRNFTAAEVLD